MNPSVSGCQAIDGCEKKETCLRYQRYLLREPSEWSAYQQCRLSPFTEHRYLHYIDFEVEQNDY
jgi:hypothetical protein